LLRWRWRPGSIYPSPRPEDYQQGITVRIMYIHVPFAWIAMMCYGMAVAALGTLVWRHPLADVSLKAAAPIGAVFTALALPPARSGASPCGAPGGSGTRG
jgi:heme exporter protein C